MRTSRLAVAFLVAFAPSLLPATALAQPPPAPDPTIQAAHARFEEGVQFYDKGQYENARASFLQAYALHKHPAVLMNLAQSSLKSGHTLDADRYFTRYIHESASLTPAQRAEAEKGLAEARVKLGRIDVIAPAGTAVTIDGDIAGTDGPTSQDVEPGTHTVKGGTETTSVTVAAGQTVMVKLGKGGAAVVPVPVPVPGGEPAPTPVAPPPAEPDVPTPADKDHTTILSRPATMAPVWIGATVSVAGFATAVIFAVFKSNAVSSYNGEVSEIETALGKQSQGACTNPKPNVASGCNALNSDANDVSNDATAANVGVAVGLVGAAFAITWYLAAPKAKSQSTSTGVLSHPHVEPILGPHLGGFALGASF